MRVLLPLLTLCCFVFSANGQSAYAPINAEYNHLVDRYEVLTGKFAPGLHSSQKPYLRKSIVALADSAEANKQLSWSAQDRFNFDYLRNDSWEWAKNPKESDSKKPLWGLFFKKKSDTYSFQNKDFDIHISPVVYVGLGKESSSSESTFINTRGLEVRGMIGQKIGFYSYFADNQAVFPEYIRQRTNFFGAIPQEGLYKSFKTAYGVDFLSARGYITFQAAKLINFQFGHDRNFIGNGYRSLILSDNSSPYLFLKVSTKIGPFQYQNLFSEIYDNQGQLLVPYGQVGPKKFFAFHHLSLNITKNINVGIFETEVHGRGKDQGYFDLNYLNPIIFYRAVEQQKNSADNAMLGVDMKINFAKKFSVYGQLLLDEFVLGEFKSDTGSWRNKFGIQAGGKYINAFGINNLDLQGEVNIVKPYTYQHVGTSTNFVNYNQAMAHPMGANFKEIIGIVRYQPLKQLTLVGTLVAASFGTDSPTLTENLGSNPLKDYGTRKQDFGNTIGQGLSNNLTYMDLTAMYMLKHNLWIDLKAVSRNQVSADPGLNKNTLYLSSAIRWNIGQRQMTY
jgi:hypothetical protein